MENWRAIEGFERVYEVSDFGGVRSLDRLARSAKREPQTIKGKMLKPGLASNGYWTVALCRDGKPRSYTVHELVAAAFIGSRPEGMVVDHRDGCRTNNVASNLRYVTQKVNSRNSSVASSASGKKGVYRNGSRWMAQIGIDGRQRHIGTFRTIEAAEAARLAFEENVDWRGLT